MFDELPDLKDMMMLVERFGDDSEGANEPGFFTIMRQMMMPDSTSKSYKNSAKNSQDIHDSSESESSKNQDEEEEKTE